MKEPKFVAFSTQKGGAGKTTLTVVMASYFYYVKGMKVLVVDCDYPQYSIEEMRQRDKDLVDCNPSFKKAFRETLQRTHLKPWPLLLANPDNAMTKVREIVPGRSNRTMSMSFPPSTISRTFVIALSGLASSSGHGFRCVR